MFIVDAICSALRARCIIVLVISSSTLAATLHEGDRTAHNVFQIPPLQVSSFALLPLILVSFPPLQSPWCSVTQGPFESRF